MSKNEIKNPIIGGFLAILVIGLVLGIPLFVAFMFSRLIGSFFHIPWWILFVVFVGLIFYGFYRSGSKTKGGKAKENRAGKPLRPLLPLAQQNLARLTALGLPTFNTPETLCSVARIQLSTLNWLMHRPERHYARFSIQKSDGKRERAILSPKKKLKAVQRWIHSEILAPALHSSASPCAHGFLPARSILTNASAHVGQEIVVRFDLRDFFPTITRRRVFGLFHAFGYSRLIAGTLAQLTTVNGKLPQGAPTSPAISNLICRKLDKRLAGLAKRFHGNYTRYADDLTFSGGNEFKLNLPTFIPRLKEILADEDFSLRADKTRFSRKGARQLVTGLVVNRGLSIPREERRRLRAILHNAKKAGSLASQNRANHPNFPDHLRGRIAFLGSVQPDKAIKLAEQFVQLA